MSSYQPSRRSSISYASNNLNEVVSRRSSLLLHRRRDTLVKITEENLALLDRINTQKAVIKFKKVEQKQSSTVFKILHLFKNKENVDTRTIDHIIDMKKGEIDKLLQQKHTKVLYF